MHEISGLCYLYRIGGIMKQLTRLNSDLKAANFIVVFPFRSQVVLHVV